MGEYQTYILYFWSIAEYYDFCGAIIQKINAPMALDNGNIPSARGHRHEKEGGSAQKRKRDTEWEEARKEDKKMLIDLRQSMEATNKALLENNILNMNSELNTLKIQYYKCEDEEEEMIEKGASERRLRRKNDQMREIRRTINVQMKTIRTYQNGGIASDSEGGSVSGDEGDYDSNSEENTSL